MSAERDHPAISTGCANEVYSDRVGHIGGPPLPRRVLLGCCHVIDAPEYIKAAETATRDLNASYLVVMLEGRYTDAYLADAGSDAPKFTSDELETIASALDFVGFGLIYVDFDTQQRIPKLGAEWFREASRKNAVV
ncbi:MAG TPA: hypothetical protein VFB50_10625 [Chloroflexota bacterium]|nr:hypothetical protein [Chloroflexota bacterium]